MAATVDDNQAKSKEELFNAFKKIDIDGSGQISKEELHDNLRGQGLDVSVKDCGVLFDIIDKDVSCLHYLCTIIYVRAQNCSCYEL